MESYVETAILKSYNFLTTGWVESLLSVMCRVRGKKRKISYFVFCYHSFSLSFVDVYFTIFWKTVNTFSANSFCCCRCCFSREFSQALVRLTKMLRGMGDPLVAVYARTYICRVSPQIYCFFIHMYTSVFVLLAIRTWILHLVNNLPPILGF